MKFFILTDLEGPAGVDSFSQTRTSDDTQKADAMKQLANEVNACVDGIRSVHPEAEIDVWDGHGSSGLHEHDLVGATYLRDADGRRAKRPYFNMDGYDALLFVGQHAMAGTAFAPLRHTYSSRHVQYYKLNDVFIGEFGARAVVAGKQGVPTIFLSGDDKAAHEAEIFIPEIITAVVKKGKGLEEAEHMDKSKACDLVRRQTIRAVQQMHDIPPLTAFSAPYTLEIRYVNPIDPSKWQEDDVTIIDERTVIIESTSLQRFPF